MWVRGACAQAGWPEKLSEGRGGGSAKLRRREDAGGVVLSAPSLGLL